MKDTTSVSNVALGFVIDHASKNRGTAKALRERMSQALGKPVHRQIVEGWLHADPDRRVEPKLGLGLILMREASLLINGEVKPLDIVKTIKRAEKNAH